ncbi:MAG: SlyX [Myxococcales bacterium]|nr:SlyX [Myxococcales bacterium]
MVARMNHTEPERETADERFMDLEVKLAFQDRLIRDLDALVRTFGTRLDTVERELRELKQAMPAPLPMGPQNEPPPHY